MCQQSLELRHLEQVEIWRTYVFKQKKQVSFDPLKLCQEGIDFLLARQLLLCGCLVLRS